MFSPTSSPRLREARRPVETIPPWKRALDLTCCAIALPILGLATALVSLLLALTSPGPIFFRQERVGYMGRRFTLYKFRTMHTGAETASHRAHFSALITAKQPMQKLDARHDTRLIAGGWLLRASGMDELPQIINVLRGDMSLVGPRPCIPYEYERYLPWHRARLATVPGLTGLWQVSGKNRTTFDEMVRLDIKYTETKSLWLDLKILVLTLPALWIQIIDTHLLRRTRTPAPVSAPAHRGTAATFQT